MLPVRSRKQQVAEKPYGEHLYISYHIISIITPFLVKKVLQAHNKCIGNYLCPDSALLYIHSNY